MNRVSFFTIKQVKETAGLYELPNNGIFENPDHVYEAIKELTDLENDASESFGLITLNTKNKITGVYPISKGSLDSSIVLPREVMQACLLANAASFVCYHNHPSGDPEPSRADVLVTERLAKAGYLMGIELLDHIIIGENRYVSMKERNLIKYN